MSEKEQEKNMDNVSFESALVDLEAIVKQLEGGKDGLESSIEAYEKGMVLKKYCESKLKEAQAKIEKITVSPEGQPQTEEFDIA